MSDFAKDVAAGLSKPEKSLPSRYLYDDEGSEIFRRIMAMPEYYLTDAEHEILSGQASDILASLDFHEAFNIVELGPGDGAKTFHFLKAVADKQLDARYLPVDISQGALDTLQQHLSEQLPALAVIPLAGDYFKVLDGDLAVDTKPKLLMFLGSNLGNYSDEQACELLKLFSSHMHQGDKVLIGADLRKNPRRIVQAYDDPGGITRAFNLNLLARINRELGGNFDLDKFDFYCHYAPRAGVVLSYLVSLAEQEVDIAALGQRFSFQRSELIATERSRKYAAEELHALAKSVGLTPVRDFVDKQHDFVDTLWSK